MANVTDEVETHDAATASSVPTVDMKFEIVVIPVSDVDRAKEFYTRLGWAALLSGITPPATADHAPRDPGVGRGCAHTTTGGRHHDVESAASLLARRVRKRRPGGAYTEILRLSLQGRTQRATQFCTCL